MNRPALWITGLAVSGAVHAGLFGVLPFWFAAEPIDNQPRPQSELRIETQEVARSESSAVPPPGDRTAVEKATGSSIAQGDIPQSRATAQDVAATPLAQVAPPTATVPAVVPDDTETTPIMAAVAPVAVIATTPPASSVVAAARIPATVTTASTVTSAVTVATNLPEATTLAADLPETMAVAADLPETTPVLASVSTAETLSAATAPAALTIATAATDTPPTAAALPATGPALSAATAAGPLATAAPVTGQSLPQGDLPADAITAALAWSGGEESQIDPQALATIQSFMRPGDIGAQSGDVRDAMADLLSQVPCARLQAEFDPETGSIMLRGHIPEEGLRAPILAALQAQVGTGLPVVDAMLILPRPQCGALAGIGTLGLPQSTEALTNPLLVGADAHARAYTYTDGDKLVLDMQAPDYDAYVYVDYFDASGDVIHLVPNDTVPLTLHPAKSAMKIGASVNGEPALEITIGPPYGQEIAVAFAASAPLFDGVRPISEPAEPYLTWLREQVAAARAADPDFKGEWVYFFVSTSGS